MASNSNGNNNNSEYVSLLGTGMYLSVRHLLSAAKMSVLAAKMEQAYPEECDLVAHQSFVLGAISASCNFIEANINEVYTEAAENDLSRLGACGEGAVELLAGVWKRGVPSKASLTTIEKYELALDFAAHDSFDRADTRYSEAQLLTRLCDSLLYFDNNWILNHGDPRRCRLEREVFENNITSRFPSKMGTEQAALGHTCAEWAVTTAIAFSDYFYEMMTMMPPYEGIRSELGKGRP